MRQIEMGCRGGTPGWGLCPHTPICNPYSLNWYDTYEGKKHDKKMADAEGDVFPTGSVLWQDTGFQGFAPDGVRIEQPTKKPCNAELSDAQKEENRQISNIRVEVEHQIGGVKQCQIVVQKFRNWVDHYIDDVMETACRLHNFRLTHRQKRGDVHLAGA